MLLPRGLLSFSLSLGLATIAVAAAADHEQVGVTTPALVDALPPMPSVQSRLDEIRDRIHEVLRYPPLARAREIEGSVDVAFEVDSERRATAIETVRSCGHPILDRAARQAVADAAPLPHVYGRLVIPIEFDLRRHP